MKISVWLHNIRSVHNIGSIFRTSDAIGVNHIYFSGYTPLPIDRFGRARMDMGKVAIGAEKNIAWSKLENPKEEMRHLQKEGYYFIALEQTKQSLNLFEYSIPEDVSQIILLLGEEVSGLEDWQIELCNECIEIPMYGKKESLNVSVAFGIVGYYLAQKK